MTLRKELLILSAAALLVTPFLVFGQSAAEPTLLVTWHADIYAPPDYAGHSLPGAGSPVVVSATLIDNGRIVNLSGVTIYWYVDGELVENGTGKQSVTVYTLDVPGAAIKVRAQIPSYKGNIVLKTVTIRSVSPEVVIDAPFAAGVVTGSHATVRARPFFFNVQDPLALAYDWTVAGQAAGSENPGVLDLVLNGDLATDGQAIPISVTAYDPHNTLSQAQSYMTLTYRQ